MSEKNQINMMNGNVAHEGDQPVKKGGDENAERGNWGGQIEFILTCVGYAVGLGNVWRFPYLCYQNGGGAFLIPYVIMLLVVGLPLFYMELAFGQFASLGPITIWRINPLFKGLGWATVIVSYVISLYYNVIVAYCLYYLVASMTTSLPWEYCREEWSTFRCRDSRNYSDPALNLTAPVMPSNITDNYTTTPSEEYFYREVLGMTDDIGDAGVLSWKLALSLFVAWLIVFIVLIKGIKSLGKVVYFTAIFPYCLLTALLVRGATLDGALDGILFYITPQWDKLLDAKVWSDALVQIFYSLSACSGGLVAMSSYNKFHNNVQRDSLIVPFINCATSIFAGFVIFSVLGFMSFEKGVSVADVAASGPGLAFIVYPEGISKMPIAPMWAILFFIMMAMLGFSSQFSMMETVISAISDEFKDTLRATNRRNIIFRGCMCLLSFVLGLPMCLNSGMYLLNLVDVNIGGYPLLFVGMTECIAIQWIYGYNRFAEDIKMMLGHTPNVFWRIVWCVVSPLAMLAVIVFKIYQHEPLNYNDTYIYPQWGQVLGWLTALFPILVMYLWLLVKFCVTYGWEACRAANESSLKWGPALEKHRTGRYVSSNHQCQDTGKQYEEKHGYDNSAYMNSTDDMTDTRF
ncbi:sodium- and chloride-dependent glycine transporter 1-like isoform X1 [Lineus longissimus]|uniref:sodium- and chloride-dependent glycine transporter 1-like isoform X1 n=1 Tax=Lineus longissimus TaxID=88925 RepID=UPI002B4C4ABF